MCRVQERQLSLSYFLSYIPLMVSAAVSCLLENLNTLGNVIIILLSYVEQIMTMCCIQERQPLLSYFLGYIPLMVSDAVSCLLQNLNTLWYIIKILYTYDEQVMTMCRVQVGWLVGFGLRPFETVFQSISGRLPKRGKERLDESKMSKQPPPAPTVSAVGPCPTVIQIVGRPGIESLPSTIAPPDHSQVAYKNDNFRFYTF